MKILKLKLIYDKFSQLPTIQDRNENLRIYYSIRINKKSYINYIEVLKKNLKVSYINKKPVFFPGKDGLFDDAGVMPSCIEKNKLFYTGWNTRKTVPYSHAIGVAEFNESKNIFERINDWPVLDRSEGVAYLANSPFVKDNKMWFCNGSGWEGNFPKYNISLAKKYKNQWKFSKKIIGKKNEACSRPFVCSFGIFFAKKNKIKNYEIFLLSKNKIKKIIKKSNGSCWDSDMTCYPCLYNNLIFYNGNNYGQTGIGVAIIE
jgi:hypothetical protein